jgi:hypothetical protein
VSKRPNLRAYFAARIDHHVNGMMARPTPALPSDVKRVNGDVTSTTITVEMLDGTVWRWSGGRYASRKVNLCYAPLMPKPIT